MNDYRPAAPAERKYVLIPPDAAHPGMGQTAPETSVPAGQPVQPPAGAPYPAPQYVPVQPNPASAPQYVPVPPSPAPQYAPAQPYPPVRARKQVPPAIRGLRRAANTAGFAAAASPLLQIVCSYLVTYAVAFLGAISGFGRYFSQNDWLLLVTAIVYPVSFILPVLLLRMTSRQPMRELLSLRRPGALYMTAVPMTVLGTVMLGVFLSDLIARLTSLFGVVSSSDLVQPASNGFFDLVFYFFLMAVMPAILEEFLFRGAMLSALRPYGDGFAILTTAAFFSIIHCNLGQAPSAFLTGLVLGYAAVVSGSIWPSVLAHFINNALALALGMLCDALPSASANLANLIIDAAYLLVGAAGCVLLFRKSRPQLRLRGGAGRFPAGKLLGTTLSRPGVIVFLAVCMLMTAMSFHAS